MPERKPQSPEAQARRAKRLEERRKVVLRSVLDLINDGELNPKMHQIVERSGTPERTIFRYFSDVGDLTMQAVDFALADHDFDLDIDSEGLDDGPLEQRIDAFVRSRLGVLGRMHLLGRVARLRVTISPEMDDTIRRLLMIRHDQIARRFAPELDSLQTGDDVVDVITALTSFESYDVSRRHLGASDDDVARCWTTAITRLLG